MKANECTLCRKCVGICRKTVGLAAISYVENESGDAAIVFSHDKCIACGSCVYICDDSALTMADAGDKRIMITTSGRMEFKLKQCRKCGDYWIPEKQLEYMAKKTSIPLESLEICLDCRD